MSDAGAAIFNTDIYLKDGKVARFGNDQDFRISFDGHGIIQNVTSDSDILFKGNDGGSTITALTLDMSAGGAATLANGLTLTDGDLAVASGHGISFAATSDGGVSTPSELLDDYEEGTWSPQYQDESGNAVTNLTNVSGEYVKVGNLVYIQGCLRTQSSSSTSGLSGSLKIAGLPFTTGNTLAGGHIVFHTHESTSSYNAPAELPRSSPVATNTTKISLLKYSGTGGRSALYQVSDLNMSGNSNFMFFAGTYRVD